MGWSSQLRLARPVSESFEIHTKKKSNLISYIKGLLLKSIILNLLKEGSRRVL